MLVLTRKVGESILIGDDIVITVFETDGKKAKIGIEAPQDVLIMRDELADKGKED